VNNEIIQTSSSPLMLDGWLEFNRVKWSLRPLRLRLKEDDKELPAIDTVVYLDKKGRITQPPLNPYLPICFTHSPTEKNTRLYRQWLKASALLAGEYKRRGIRCAVSFPPEITDIRQWQWLGYIAEVRYTFCLELTAGTDKLDYQVIKQIKKAENAGFTYDLLTKSDFEGAVECLADTESRQGFSYRLGVSDIRTAQQLLGEEHLRVFVCRAPSGEVACARIVIVGETANALDWVAGTGRRFYNSGATQYLTYRVINELSRTNVRYFDFCGANLSSVSAAKANWGGDLRPYYLISAPSLRTLFRLGYVPRFPCRRRS